MPRWAIATAARTHYQAAIAAPSLVRHRSVRWPRDGQPRCRAPCAASSRSGLCQPLNRHNHPDWQLQARSNPFGRAFVCEHAPFVAIWYHTTLIVTRCYRKLSRIAGCWPCTNKHDLRVKIRRKYQWFNVSGMARVSHICHIRLQIVTILYARAVIEMAPQVHLACLSASSNGVPGGANQLISASFLNSRQSKLSRFAEIPRCSMHVFVRF